VNQTFAYFSQKLHIMLKPILKPLQRHNIEFKPLSSSLRDEFLSPNKTYLVFMNVNLDPAQTKSVLIFYLKINTSDDMSCESLENISKHIFSTWHEHCWKNYDAVGEDKKSDMRRDDNLPTNEMRLSIPRPTHIPHLVSFPNSNYFIFVLMESIDVNASSKLGRGFQGYDMM
jgi:hypothetical protein